jgi:predicted SnoaL-like aldol condensation-catalyzing enzyme
MMRETVTDVNEAVVVYFKELSQHLPRQMSKTTKYLRVIFEIDTSRIHTKPFIAEQPGTDGFIPVYTTTLFQLH